MKRYFEFQSFWSFIGLVQYSSHVDFSYGFVCKTL